AQNQGKKAEGAQNQGKKAEGAQNQGKKAEGAQNQGKKAEGAQNQGKEKVLPVKFSFKLESNDGSILNVKTPEIKVFVELEDEEIYKNRKEINELDSAVIKLQSQFRETSLDSSKYSELTFPKKSEGAQNQGKKAEGAQNQGKKAEGVQNQTADTTSLKSYLPELGKKVSDYLASNFKDKNYKTLVESISDSFGKTTKELFFVLVKDETSSGSESSTASTTPQKRSTLRVKITISKTETASTTSTTTAGTVSSSS
ncbi:adhesin, partial [Mesomycoplasma ovipneumoniae]|nr:adhesin [Mesomycoplasma ovipneumoniae]